MPIPDNFRGFWQTFAMATGVADESRFYEAFAFGDSAALADELAGLVLSGTKRATAGSFWAFELEGKQLPKAGDLSIVKDGAGAPLCVIETRSVEVVPFSRVDAGFAADEGEGDGSLAYWREAHRRYFTRECGRLGKSFHEGMPVVCERFEVVFQPAEA